MERMLDEKQIRVIVLFDFKMRHKAAETTCNINNPSGPGTANARTVQWCFKKYAEETRALKMRTVRAGHRKLQWWTEKIIKADPLTTAEVTEELSVDHSMVIPHLKGSGKVKRLCKWVPYELTENLKKTVFLKCHLLLLYATHHFSIGLWHVMKGRFIWQPATTSSVAGLRRSSEALLKAKLTPKKGHGQIQKKKKDHSHSLVVCCPSDPLQLSESWWNHYIWEVCSANWWDALKTATSAGSIGQLKGPNSPRHLTTRCTSSASKVEPIGLWSFALSTVFT